MTVIYLLSKVLMRIYFNSLFFFNVSLELRPKHFALSFLNFTTIWIKPLKKHTYINCSTWLVAGCYFYVKRWKLLTWILGWLKNIQLYVAPDTPNWHSGGANSEGQLFKKKKSKSVSLQLEVSLTWNQDGAILEKLSLTLFGFKTKKRSTKSLSGVFTFARRLNCHSSQEVIQVHR